MRVTQARQNGSLSCKRALMVIVGVAAGSVAWAETDELQSVAPAQQVTEQDGSSQPPAAPKLAPHAGPTNVSAETPRGSGGGDDRRLFMLMMLGRVFPGGPFGRLGQ